MKANIPVFTNKMRKAMVDEVNRQTAGNVLKLSRNLQAIVLWVLHVHPSTKFGKKRLLRFQKDFVSVIEELKDFFMSESAEETEFYCMYKLKHEVGIDVKELDEIFRLEVAMKDGDGNG